MFIIVSRKSTKYAIKYIKRHSRGKRIIIWYWNIYTKKELNPEYCRRIGCETWSFDKKDCEKYNMKFGDTYYFLPEKSSSNNIKYDIFYVGINRPGREEFLNKLKQFCDDNKLTYKINLTAIPNQSFKTQKKYDNRMSYEEIIKTIKESNAILDLNRSNQSGMTLRPMEAIFFNKKLITNNSDIVNYNAYDKENMFIIENNLLNIKELTNFLKKEKYKINDEILSKYIFENWLYRIINNIQSK